MQDFHTNTDPDVVNQTQSLLKQKQDLVRSKVEEKSAAIGKPWESNLSSDYDTRQKQVLADALVTDNSNIPYNMRVGAVADNLVGKGYDLTAIDPLVKEGNLEGLRALSYETPPAASNTTPKQSKYYSEAVASPVENVPQQKEEMSWDQAYDKAKYDKMGVLGRAGNFAKGVGYYGASSLVDTADAVLEGGAKVIGAGVSAAGFDKAGKAIDAWEGVGTEEEKSKMMKELTGYNSAGVDAAMERAKGYVDSSLKGVELLDPTTWGKATAGGFVKALGEVWEQPELAASIAYVLGPGWLVKGGAKVAEKVAGRLISDKSTLDNVINGLRNERGQALATTAALGGAINNNDLDTLRDSLGTDEQGVHNEVGMGRALFGWAINSAAAGLDIMAAKKVIGMGDRPLTEVFKELGENKARALVGTVAYGAVVAAKAGMLEAPQEFVQSYVEAFNETYGGKDENGNEVGYKKALNDGLSEAVLGSMAGLSSGTYMSAGMQVGRAGLDVAKSGIDSIGPQGQSTPVNAVEKQAPVEVKESNVKQYTNTLVELRDAIQGNKVTADTIGDYVSKVEQLHDIRTGIEGFTPEQLKGADDTYKVIANKFNEIILSNPDLKLSKVVTPDVLGSAPDMSELESVQATVDSKGADPLLAERVMSIAMDAAGSDTVSNNAVKYVRFAINNGMDRKDAIDLVKNYAAVEEEATVGDRGYLTYAARAKSLLASDNPDQGQIDLVYDKLLRFRTSTEKSLHALESTVEGAKLEANKLTVMKASDFGGKSKRYKGTYKKLDGKSFDVDMVRDKATGVWSVANNAALNNILEAKKRTIAGIDKALSSLGAKRTGVPLNVGQLIVPNNAATEGVAKSQKSDLGQVNSALEKLSAVIGERRVNKVIVDDETAGKKWKVTGDYYQANSPIINTGEYSATDVVYVHGNKEGSKGVINWMKVGTKKLGAHPAAEEMLKAVDAGATIVLDRSFRVSKTTTSKNKEGKSVTRKAGTMSAEGNALVKYLKGKGYELVPGTVDTLVRVSEDTKAKIEEINKVEAAAQEASKARKEDLKTLTDLYTVLEANRLGTIALNAEKLKAVQEEYETLKKKVVAEQFTKVDKKELDEDLQEASNILDVDENGEFVSSPNLDNAVKVEHKGTPEENLMKHLRNKLDMMVKDKVLAYGASEVLNEGDPDLLAIGNLVSRDENGKLTNVGKGSAAHVLALMAVDKAKELAQNDVEIERVLTEWQKILDERLDEATTNSKVEELIRNSGISKLVDADGNKVNLGKDLLESTASKGMSVRYITNSAKGSMVMSEMPTDLQIAEHGITSVVEVNPDVNSYVTGNGKTTLLNTVVVSELPLRIRAQVTAFGDKVKALVNPLGKDAVKHGVVTNSEHFHMADSPARGLLFNSKGVMSPQVTAAMWVAMMETMQSDKFKLTLGARSRADVANMLNVPESQVTKKQMEFAKNHGMLNKSLANTLGKAVLAELGLSKKQGDYNKGHYELLASDLGNMAIVAAESLGWLEYKNPSVKEVSEFFGKEVSADYKGKSTLGVRYVHIAPKMINKNRELTGDLAVAYTTYEDNKEILPVVNTARKEPKTTITEEQIEKNKTSVRNDVTGGVHAVPIEAQKTLDTLMRTKYTMDVKAANEFLKLVDAEGSKVKELLGYIPIDENNKAYSELSYDDKDIQVSINRDIDKSIDELRMAVNNKDGNYEVQYVFYYTRNGRYMMDSNTINPQSDKIHRFLMQPSAHTLTYAVEGNGSSTKFAVNGEDTSYYVRLALVQAFGGDIDKSSTKDIINMGSKLLGLTGEQLAEVKQAIITTGKYKANGLELEATHITHTLQGIDFLEQVLTGSVTSALTAEFDSVTNGFMNKLMQLPILKKQLKEHLARVGILSKEFLTDPNNPNAKELAKLIDLENGESVNSMLSKAGAALGFLDSYKNLAMSVADGLKKSSNATYKKFKDYLPSPDADGGISSELRTLFKAPFMTFNYSASIERISANLSENLVTGLIKEVATGSEKGRAIARKFVEGGFTVDGKNYSGKNEAVIESSIDLFIKTVRTRPLSDIKVQGKSLMDTYSAVFNEVYGTLVKKAFTDNFKEFIELQDRVNDAFKITYRLFEQELHVRLQELERSKKKVTEEDYRKVIKDLWGKFPAIEGPMTQAIEGDKYDVIPVTDSGTTSNETGAALRDTAQTKLVDKNSISGVRSITVHAVMRFLKEAGKAGAVLPFHYIDGAELGRTINTLHDAHGNAVGFTPIHDAMMVPVTRFADATFTYNKELVDTNRNYSLIDAVVKMAEGWKFAKGVKYVSTGLNVVGKSKDMDFELAARKVQEALKATQVVVEEERKKLFDESSGLLFNNMVGAANGYYKIGMDKPAATVQVTTTEETSEVVGAEDVDSNSYTGEAVTAIINDIETITKQGC